MRAAEVSQAVWAALLASARDPSVSCEQPFAQDAEMAAWDLYSPLVAPRGTEPYMFAQVGQSLDGRVATVSGDSADISGPDGLKHLHRCRALSDAVVIGVRTALTDDPRLTVRLVEGDSPARVVIDPQARLPNDARVLAEDGVRRLVIQTRPSSRPAGVEVIVLQSNDGWIAPGAIRTALADRGLSRVLVEGGGVTIAGFLEAGLLDRLHVSVAPIIIGAGPTGLRTAPIARLADALRPVTSVYGLDSDVVFDCAFQVAGSARMSRWPMEQEETSIAARRA